MVEKDGEEVRKTPGVPVSEPDQDPSWSQKHASGPSNGLWSCGACHGGQPSRSANGRVRPLRVKSSWLGTTLRSLSLPRWAPRPNKKLGLPFEFAGFARSPVTFFNSNLPITLDMGSIPQQGRPDQNVTHTSSWRFPRIGDGSGRTDRSLRCPSRPSCCFSVFLALDFPHLSQVR